MKKVRLLMILLVIIGLYKLNAQTRLFSTETISSTAHIFCSVEDSEYQYFGTSGGSCELISPIRRGISFILRTPYSDRIRFLILPSMPITISGLGQVTMGSICGMVLLGRITAAIWQGES